jgi:hypothetical protein
MAINALSELEDFGDGERPWCDLVFEVTDARRAHVDEGPSGKPVIALHALATVPRGDIGFGARVHLDDWKSNENAFFHWGQISLCSIGTQTDRLLALYEEWFGLPPSGSIVPEEIGCSAAILGDDPRNLEKKHISTKLFFDAAAEGTPESYAELFFNFDLPANRAWLREKDPGYRRPLTDWFAGRYQSPTSSAEP